MNPFQNFSQSNQTGDYSVHNVGSQNSVTYNTSKQNIYNHPIIININYKDCIIYTDQLQMTHQYHSSNVQFGPQTNNYQPQQQQSSKNLSQNSNLQQNIPENIQSSGFQQQEQSIQPQNPVLQNNAQSQNHIQQIQGVDLEEFEEQKFENVIAQQNLDVPMESPVKIQKLIDARSVQSIDSGFAFTQYPRKIKSVRKISISSANHQLQESFVDQIKNQNFDDQFLDIKQMINYLKNGSIERYQNRLQQQNILFDSERKHHLNYQGFNSLHRSIGPSLHTSHIIPQIAVVQPQLAQLTVQPQQQKQQILQASISQVTQIAQVPRPRPKSYSCQLFSISDIFNVQVIFTTNIKELNKSQQRLNSPKSQI